MSKRLIVTADDFGRCLEINQAVEHAHTAGILTAASLMVTGAALSDAVERARRLPDLGVGLHVTLVDGTPALPPGQVPDLVGPDGRFTTDLVRLGTRIFLLPKVRAQVKAELRAQFELYRATSLPMAHVDSHHHYHLHPTVFAIMLPLAVEYGAKGVRVPWESPLASWRARRRDLGTRIANGLFHYRRASAMRRAIRQAGLVANDRVFGVNDSGAMDRDCLLDILGALPDGLTELYGHPATARWADRPMPERYRVADEYRALIDPAVRERLAASGARLTHFAREAGR
ncbi:MAG: hopanoid biosynthesis-associated protein HpnK [Actinomycetota bacterium]